MKKITVKLYDDLSDEFGKHICEKDEGFDNLSSVGFTCAINPFHEKVDNNKIEDKYNEYLFYFKKYISKLISDGDIEKIYHIGAFELARVSPVIRVGFICYCNEIKNKDIVTFKEGETPKIYTVDEILKELI